VLQFATSAEERISLLDITAALTRQRETSRYHRALTLAPLTTPSKFRFFPVTAVVMNIRLSSRDVLCSESVLTNNGSIDITLAVRLTKSVPSEGNGVPYTLNCMYKLPLDGKGGEHVCVRMTCL
jgi:hypothetical protein